ncbi:hypothetical protein pb186bvf_016126 [Paramecium bursaria]
MRVQDITIKTQVIVVSTITMIITIAGVMILQQYFMNQVQEQLGTFMQYLFDRETSNFLETLTSNHNRIIQYDLQRRGIKIRNIDEVFEKIQQFAIYTQVRPQDCLLNFSKSSNDTYAMQQSICYSIFNKSNLPFKDLRLFNNLSSILTELLPISNYKSKQEPQTTLLYASIDPAQYYVQYSGLNLTGFIPQSRIWYKSHIQLIKTKKLLIQYSEPYFAQNNQIYISQTTNLTYLNRSLAGVIATPINFRSLPQLNCENCYVYLVNVSGYVVLGDFYKNNVSVIYHLNQTQVTGFSNQDWVDIQKASLNQSILKLKNQKLNSTVYLKPIQWENPQFYLIIFYNGQTIENDQAKFHSQFSIKLNIQYWCLIIHHNHSTYIDISFSQTLKNASSTCITSCLWKQLHTKQQTLRNKKIKQQYFKKYIFSILENDRIRNLPLLNQQLYSIKDLEYRVSEKVPLIYYKNKKTQFISVK